MPIVKERMLALIEEAMDIHEAHETIRAALRTLLPELTSPHKERLASILAETEIPLPTNIMKESIHFQATAKRNETAKNGMRLQRLRAGQGLARPPVPRPLAQARNAAARLAPDIATSTPTSELVIHDEGRIITIEPDEDRLTPDKIEESGLDL